MSCLIRTEPVIYTSPRDYAVYICYNLEQCENRTFVNCANIDYYAPGAYNVGWWCSMCYSIVVNVNEYGSTGNWCEEQEYNDCLDLMVTGYC